MPDDSAHDDIEIIGDAYAERVREAFKVFAENLTVGQSEQLCREGFMRALQLARRVRGLALQAMRGELVVDPAAAQRGAAAREETVEALSAEDQALVDSALAGTTGVAAPAPVPRYRGR